MGSLKYQSAILPHESDFTCDVDPWKYEHKMDEIGHLSGLHRMWDMYQMEPFDFQAMRPSNNNSIT